VHAQSLYRWRPEAGDVEEILSLFSEDSVDGSDGVEAALLVSVRGKRVGFWIEKTSTGDDHFIVSCRTDSHHDHVLVALDLPAQTRQANMSPLATPCADTYAAVRLVPTAVYSVYSQTALRLVWRESQVNIYARYASFSWSLVRWPWSLTFWTNLIFGFSIFLVRSPYLQTDKQRDGQNP